MDESMDESQFSDIHWSTNTKGCMQSKHDTLCISFTWLVTLGIYASINVRKKKFNSYFTFEQNAERIYM